MTWSVRVDKRNNRQDYWEFMIPDDLRIYEGYVHRERCGTMGTMGLVMALLILLVTAALFYSMYTHRGNAQASPTPGLVAVE